MPIKNEQRLFKELGIRIAQLRKEKGLSQERLSELTGLDRVAIGYIEQGRRHPTVSTLFKIANGLGIKLQDLVKGF